MLGWTRLNVIALRKRYLDLETSIRRWVVEALTVPSDDESQQTQATSSPRINTVFSDEELQAIQQYYDLQASLFSDEICELLYLKFGKVHTEKQVDRARRKLNLTAKLME